MFFHPRTSISESTHFYPQVNYHGEQQLTFLGLPSEASSSSTEIACMIFVFTSPSPPL